MNIDIEYLRQRKELLNIGSTDGKWDREVEEKIFGPNLYIDSCIEVWGLVGESILGIRTKQPTPKIKVGLFDLIKEGIYKDFIPEDENQIFSTFMQSIQVFKDHPYLFQDVINKKAQFIIPFTNKKRDEKSLDHFILHLFKLGKMVKLTIHYTGNPDTFSTIWKVKDNNVIILPKNSIKKYER